MTRKQSWNSQRKGLILLVVLGMLTLFTLLCVSYVVLSRNSLDASRSIELVTRKEIPVGSYAEAAVRQVVRGSTDRRSTFFGHDLLGDIYGNPDVIYGRKTIFSNLKSPVTPHFDTTVSPAICAFLQLSLHNVDPDGVDVLSTEDDAYNGRLITILGGPLAGNTFRILHFVASPPSVLIDARDVASKDLTGLVSGNQVTMTLAQWANTNPNALAVDTATNTFYRYLINQPAFSGVGYGTSIYKHMANFSTDGSTAGTPVIDNHYGNLGQIAWTNPGSNPNLPNDMDNLGPGIPVGILHSYDAGFDPVSGRQLMQYKLNPDNSGNGVWEPATNTQWQFGDTNEGIDVPDHRDLYLGYVPVNPTNPKNIIPSYHRPEVINYISNHFGRAEDWTLPKLFRFLNILDYAMARPVSYKLYSSGMIQFADTQLDPYTNQSANSSFYPGVAKSRNIHFGPSHLQLSLNLDSWPNATEVGKLQQYVSNLIVSGVEVPMGSPPVPVFQGGWDLDNDGDGISDSVWVDPDFPIINGPNGQLVKVLVSPLIEDLDGRVNLNTAGDLTTADERVRAVMQNKFLVDSTIGSDGSVSNVPISQGLGYGPADISVTSLFQATSTLKPGYTRVGVWESLFDMRNGVDDLPGLPMLETTSLPFKRDSVDFHAHQRMPGMPLSRRGTIGWGLDRFGNPLFYQPPYSSIPAISETNNDSYESSPNTTSYGDQHFSLAELETVLRRYDSDVENLPQRLRNFLKLDQTYSTSSAVNRVITVRSSELRNMPIPVAGSSVAPSSPHELTLNAGNALGWVKSVHENRFRKDKPALPSEAFDPAQHDPVLTTANVRELFPVEFRKGLRFDINRPFGDGVDNDNDGQIDEPQELEAFPQLEGTVAGDYSFGTTATPARLASRQLFARHLYCLAQLVVPRDYALPGMHDVSGTFDGSPEFRRRRARVLAQWAVNVVDFRDMDAAMTRFEYDELPFGLKGSPAKTPGWTPQPGNVVWGMEFPEMQLSESLATHDLRQKDTAEDSTGQKKPGDPTVDQYRLPQGSLFVELVNLRTTGAVDSATLPAAPTSLYSNNGGSMALDLARTSPGDWPVWRIGVSNVQNEAAAPQNVLQTQVDQFVSQTHQFSDPTSNANLTGLHWNLHQESDIAPTFDRMILFTSALPASVPNIGTPANLSARVFLNKSSTLYLPGGSHLVVGPRSTTYFGSQKSSRPKPKHTPSPQRITINGNRIRVFGLNGNEESPWTDAQPNAFGMICAADAPDATWDGIMPPMGGDYQVGLNVSEPLSVAGTYYRIPTQRINSDDQADSSGFPAFQQLPMDSWHDYHTGLGQLPDEPLDTNNPVLSPVLNGAGRDLRVPGTYQNVRTLYLQRLADPELPYDAVYNPYITIDMMPVDLTVFNGEDDESTSPTPKYAFQSRYKDGADAAHLDIVDSTTRPTPKDGSFFEHAPFVMRPTSGTQLLSYSVSPLVKTPGYTGPNVDTRDGALPAYFKYELGYYNRLDAPISATQRYSPRSATTLGRINEGFKRSVHSSETGPNAPARLPVGTGEIVDTDPNNFHGFGTPFDDPSVSGGGADGYPRRAVSNLFWANRSFATNAELMLVPFTAPGMYQQQATLGSFKNTTSGAWHNLKGIVEFDSSNSNALNNRHIRKPFGAYLNFFESSDMKLVNDSSTNTPFWQRGRMSGTTDKFPNHADYNLLLELTETPPRYSDSASYFHGSLATGSAASMLGNFKAPFNSVSSYVASGKVNLNTIPNEEALKAVDAMYLRDNEREGSTGYTVWPYFEVSRRGYADGMSHSFFTQIAEPNPILSPVMPTQFNGAFASSFMENIRSPEERNRPGDNTASGVGLLRNKQGDVPLFTDGAAAWGRYAHAETTPAIAYQRLIRLPNLVSQQSNVFSIRMTVGFFAFDPDLGIGRELSGIGTEMKRQQSFFIVDRSIPVGYKPGEDINTDKIILFRRQSH